MNTITYGLWSGQDSVYEFSNMDIPHSIRRTQMPHMGWVAPLGVCQVFNSWMSRANLVRQSIDSRRAFMATMDGIIERSVLSMMQAGDTLESALYGGQKIDLEDSYITLADTLKQIATRNSFEKPSGVDATRRRLNKQTYNDCLKFMYNLAGAQKRTLDEDTLGAGNFVLIPPILDVGAWEGNDWVRGNHTTANILKDSTNIMPWGFPASLLAGIGDYPSIDVLMEDYWYITCVLWREIANRLDDTLHFDGGTSSIAEGEGERRPFDYVTNYFLRVSMGLNVPIESMWCASTIYSMIVTRSPDWSNRLNGFSWAAINSMLVRIANKMIFMCGDSYTLKGQAYSNYRTNIPVLTASRSCSVSANFNFDEQSFQVEVSNGRSATWGNSLDNHQASWSYSENQAPSCLLNFQIGEVYDLSKVASAICNSVEGYPQYDWLREIGYWIDEDLPPDVEEGDYLSVTYSYAELKSIIRRLIDDYETEGIGPAFDGGGEDGFIKTFSATWTEYDEDYTSYDARGLTYPCNYAIANDFVNKTIYGYGVAKYTSETQGDTNEFGVVASGGGSSLSQGKQEDAFEAEMEKCFEKLLAHHSSVLATLPIGRKGIYKITKDSILSWINSFEITPDASSIKAQLDEHLRTATYNGDYRFFRFYILRGYHYTWTGKVYWVDPKTTTHDDFVGGEISECDPTPSTLSRGWRIGSADVSASYYARTDVAEDWDVTMDIPLWIGGVDWLWKSVKPLPPA